MSITLLQATAATRVRLDEATARAWTDVEIKGWINEAVSEIARRTEALDAQTTVAVTADVQDVILPADIIRIHRVEWDSGQGQILPLEIRELSAMDSVWFGGSQSTPGSPRYIALKGFPPALTGVLYPIPNTTGTSITVYYYQSPSPLETDGTNDDVTLSIPTGWEDLIYDYATQCAQRRDGNPAWQDTRSVFETKLTQMIDTALSYHNQGGYITPDTNPWDRSEYWW